MQRKKRRNRRFDRVTKRTRELGANRISSATRSKKQLIASRQFPITQSQLKTALSSNTRLFDPFAREQSNADPLRFANQTIDDRFRRICYRKHPAVSFPFETNAPR